ncbi:zincin-like metallopeptidase domain-containing protein [Sphingomonas qomolangmaensis]|uniref:Zincin-like metallopeptidase domain-containing protein n=1 Tax=Sphingomonas qomolangmaensis TaxID=2918765 RepID=A0ABY5L6Y8_9SPHN|nr:zincin-like metallopeptidase domain-containing protein [Sphingomonas qomolangmaensis]UUL82557.1 zincin-like metallopeptidase domain-containing protein [Sphingomonas qomolangmaensis]
MSKDHKRRTRGEVEGSTARASIYGEVTARVVAELEAGRFPWVQPWDAAAAAPGLPRNAASNRAYSGINVLILWGEVIARGYASQGWLTFRQALDAGGCVRKGEHGVGVVYADRFTPEAEKERAVSEGGEARAVPFLKRFTLFNVAQCDGLPERMLSGAAPLPPREIVPVAEALIAATSADFRIGGAEAYYAPAQDYVRVPPQPAFRHQIDYYRTALHELGHWTGHPSRLARDLSNPFGSEGYAREELVAELASAFLCAALGIVPSVRHADYLGSWLAVLRADNRAIFRAASLASKAADFLLTFHSEAPAMEGAA